MVDLVFQGSHIDSLESEYSEGLEGKSVSTNAAPDQPDLYLSIFHNSLSHG